MYFRQGFSYVAGFDKPWVASISAIAEAVTEEGFQVLLVRDCEKFTQRPFSYPQKAGPCGDEWDYVAMVVRRARSAQLDVPDRVKWIVEIAPAQMPVPELPPPARTGVPPTALPPPPTPQPTLTHVRQKRDRRRDVHMLSEALGLAVVAPVMWYASREVSTPLLRTSLKAAAVGTAAVDAYLLWSYLAGR